MTCHCIPYNQIASASRLFTDYLYDFARVSEFYAHNPSEQESFPKAARAIRYENDFRQQVVAILREQNRRLSASEKTLENLKRLESSDCVAVVTGHQAGLFSGPVFSLYKGLTAIKLASELTSRGLQAVPIYWVATEDHDLEEVNHCFIQDREGNPQRLSYDGSSPVANAPVGSITFSEAIVPLVENLRALLPESSSTRQLVDSLSECYRPGVTFGMAFGAWMARALSEFGIVMMDPMDRRLHQLSSPVFQAAVASAQEIVKDLRERNRRLTDAGYHAQVHVTEDFSLLFVYVNGERRALRLQGGRLVSAQGDSYSPDELMARIERQPETVSANVLLRPVMQDTLLPTVAYVGGPSELAYMAQAGPVYQRILGRIPVVFPRASFTILDGPTNRLLGKYGLTLPEIWGGKQSLREKMAERFLPAELTEVFQRASSNLEGDLEAVRASLAKLDPTLADAAENSGRKMQYQLSTLERKATAAIQNRSDQIERDALRLENNLYPDKTPQERLYSGISYLARYGPDFLKQIHEQIHLHSAQHQVIEMQAR